MPSSGPLNPGTMSSNHTTGEDGRWANINNAKVDDGVYATTAISAFGPTFDFVIATNFGFAIPVGATITGIQISIHTAAPRFGCSAYLIVNGIKAGTFHGTAYGPGNITSTYGNNSDLWGLTLTPAIVNSSNFGFEFNGAYQGQSGIVYLDVMQMTVYYVLTAPSILTGVATNPTQTTATANGTVSSDGGSTITTRGVQYGLTESPDQSVSESGSFSTGTFGEALTGLIPGTTYFYRSYATNAIGTSYGNWISFKTLPNTYTITINGVDRTADILMNTLSIEDVINDRQTNCKFSLTDLHSLGPPVNDTEITIDPAVGRRLFGGYIIKSTQSVVQGSYVQWDVECVDYTRLMDRNLINKSYLGGQYDSAIIDDIVATFCAGTGITTEQVLQGVAIDMIAFNYIQFSAAMRIICDLTGRNWFIDYFKDINYFPLTQNPAPFNITDSPTFAGGNGYFGINISQDNSQLKNRVFVRGGTYLSNATQHTQKGDGVKKKFNIPDKPHSVSISVNGTTKTLGIKNIDTSGYDWYLNYEEKYIEQDVSGTVLSTSDSVQLTYQYDIPILVALENTSSILANGAHEYIIVDKSIRTAQAARDRATAELTDFASGLVEGSFSTYTPGFRSGQYVNINSTVMGINNQNYIVQKVIATAIGGGNFVYQIYLASAKTLGIIRFLLELLEQNKNLAQVSTNEVLDNLITLNDSLNTDSITDSLTIDSAGPYRTWCVDSLDVAPSTRAIWNLFSWK